MAVVKKWQCFNIQLALRHFFSIDAFQNIFFIPASFLLLVNRRQYSNNRVNEQDVLAEWYKTSSQIVVNEQNHELTSLTFR